MNSLQIIENKLMNDIDEWLLTIEHDDPKETKRNYLVQVEPFYFTFFT